MASLRNLLLNTMSPNCGGVRRLTPLMAAGMIGNVKCMQMLLNYKADANYQHAVSDLPDSKLTALFVALDSRQLEPVVFLVRDVKVDLRMRNGDNMTALELAEYMKWEPVIEGIKKHSYVEL